MIPVKIQLALFFQNTLQRPEDTYISFNKQMNNLFNDTPTILPIPEDAPGNIPVVQLSSKNTGYRVNISRKRTDLFLNPNNEELDKIIKDYKIKVDNFIDYFVNISKIDRMGFVVDNFIISNAPLKKINDKYFKKDLSNSKELKVRFNKRGKINNFEYNHITEISNVTGNFKGKKREGILIHKDLNNVKSKKKLNKKELINLFEEFENHLKSKEIKELL